MHNPEDTFVGVSELSLVEFLKACDASHEDYVVKLAADIALTELNRKDRSHPIGEAPFDLKAIADRSTFNGTRSSGNALLDAVSGVGDFNIKKSMDFFFPNPFESENLRRAKGD